MRIVRLKINARVALGCLTLAGVVASSAVFLNREAYKDFHFAEVMEISDTVKYVTAAKYPAIQSDLLAGSGFKDIDALRARVDSDKQAVSTAQERMNRRLLIDCMTLVGSLAVFIMAGITLVLPAQRSRQSKAEALGV